MNSEQQTVMKQVSDDVSNTQRSTLSGVEPSSAVISETDMNHIREDILNSQRDIAEASSFKESLDAIQKFAEGIPAQEKALGFIAQATTEKQMHKAIARERMLGPRYDEIDSWSTKVSTVGEMATFFVPSIALCGALTANFNHNWIEVSDAMGLCSFLFMILWPLIGAFCISTTGPLGAIQIRNRVIRRKAYKRELQRLMREAESARERKERLRGVREAKLSAARKALEPLSADFALANPGSKLDIVEDNGSVRIDAVDDERYTQTGRLAAKALSGRADGGKHEG